ncbi:MFS transporter [Staphylococcus sp. ACRSN]|uniref:MFS transporter n=1 Tax=Staphylococcus sp. ACRSN TaxID=2918214 RepID=UPI001EF3BD6D|nr:MFS transporter [Staphylococcus sp. ACRSN]MCG7338846.1 MFS transporter [Staphylococcus sp. ACRSN]
MHKNWKLSRFTVLLFAVASGLAIGNLYLTQPLFKVIASSLDITPTSASILVTVTQLGYALGVFLLVPLGDVLNRKLFIPLVMSLSGLMLIGASVAPNFSFLLLLLGLLGLTTVAGQLLIPLSSELADSNSRGRVVGIVSSGALTGILVSRTVSGVISDLINWRFVFGIAGILIILIAIVLFKVIPKLPTNNQISYIKLLLSVFNTVKKYKVVPPTLAITALIFANFSLFWTSLTYLLSDGPFYYSVSQIGLFGLIGLVGALAAQRAGIFHDRGLSIPVTGISIILIALSLVIGALFSNSIIAIIIVIIILDVATQSALVLGQTRLFNLPVTERSRLNTAIVVGNFIGGAIGSIISGPIWASSGWLGIMSTGLALNVLALLIWLFNRRSNLVLQS